MPDDADSGTLVSLAELKELAELFDSAENAMVPDSPDAKAAQVAFDNKVQELYDDKLAPDPHFSALIAQPIFKAQVRTKCRQFLRKN